MNSHEVQTFYSSIAVLAEHLKIYHCGRSFITLKETLFNQHYYEGMNLQQGSPSKSSQEITKKEAKRKLDLFSSAKQMGLAAEMKIPFYRRGFFSFMGVLL